MKRQEQVALTKPVINVDDDAARLGEQGEGSCVSASRRREGRRPVPPTTPATKPGPVGVCVGGAPPPTQKRGRAEGTSAGAVSVSIPRRLLDPPSPWVTDRRVRRVLHENPERPRGRAGG